MKDLRPNRNNVNRTSEIKPFGRPRLLASALLLTVTSVLLTGCWDRTEINDIAIVLATAIDKEPDGQYRFSVEVPLPGNLGGPSGGGGGSGGKEPYYIDSAVGRTIREAGDNLQKRMSRRLFYSHRRVVVIGEDMAKQGIQKIFDPLPRLPESRLTTYMVVAKGKAYDLLRTKPKFERFSAEVMRELAKGPSVLDVNMKKVAVQMSYVGSDPVAIYMAPKSTEKAGEKPSEEIEVLGYAVFKDDRMVGVLDKEDAIGIAWLRGKVRKYQNTLQIKNGEYLTYLVKQGSVKFRPSVVGDRVRFRYDLEVSAYVHENSNADLNQIPILHDMERRISDHVKQTIQSTFAKLQKQQTDAGSFGVRLWRNYPALWETKFSRDWPAYFQHVELDVNVQTKLINEGLIFQNIIKEENK